jgi:hypothetical protein
MRVALLALLAVGLSHDNAEACSCEGRTWFAPADGSVDVPTNLASITYSGWGDGLTLTDDAGNEIDLGADVPLDGYFDGVHRVDVIGALLPDTHYQLTDGTEGPAVVAFTTGAANDTSVPAVVTVSSLRAQYTEWGPNVGDSCGNQHGSLYGATAGVEPGATLFVKITGTNYDETRASEAGSSFGFSSQSCSIDLDVTPCSDYTVDVWQVDLAGHAGPRATHSVHVLGCPRMEALGDPGCTGYTGPDVCMPYEEDDRDHEDGSDVDDSGGCATSGASVLGAFALLGLRRRRRCA